jgi:hypothetical protein
MSGQYVAPKLGMITVGELAPAWLARKQSDVAPSNYRTLEAAWRIHVQPAWGTTRIADVDLAAVERWIATMRRKSGATTVIRAYGVLAGILDDAVKARRLAANPARGAENLPRKSNKRRVYLSAEPTRVTSPQRVLLAPGTTPTATAHTPPRRTHMPTWCARRDTSMARDRQAPGPV